MKKQGTTQNSKFNIYELISNKIIEKLEAGTVPWNNPLNNEFGIAYNWVSQKAYTGVNQILLDKGEYLTFKQVQDNGGRVKPGEKGNVVVFYQNTQFEVMNENEDEVVSVKKIPLIRYYYVFRLDQIEGIEPKREDNSVNNNPIEACQNIINNYHNKPIITCKDNSLAYYSPGNDYINVPNINNYASSEDYYSTLFHECIHSTGHQNRLNRSTVVNVPKYGTDKYDKEELIAEIGSAFLCAFANISKLTLDNAASYIQGWKNAIKADNKLVITAASAAQKAVDYIMNTGE